MRRTSTGELQAQALVMQAQAAELVDLVNAYRTGSMIREHLSDPDIGGTLRGIARAQLRIWTAERDRLVVLLLRYLSIEDVRRRRMRGLPTSHRYRSDLL